MLDLDLIKFRSRAVEFGEVDIHLEFQLIALAVETRYRLGHRAPRRVEVELQACDVQAEADIQLVDFLSSCHLHHIVNEFFSVLFSLRYCQKLLFLC